MVYKAVAALAGALAAGAAWSAGLDGETLRVQLERDASTAGGRAEVTLGQIDPRLQLAPCARVEPFVPPGVRLWGRTIIGLRCAEGATWSVTLPIQVRIFTPALVATRTLAPGATLDAADYTVAEVEVTREPPGVLTDPAQTRDKILTRGLAAGQTLRADHLRAQPVVANGDPVRVVYQGPGFTVGADGKALGTAPSGGTVRVQLDGGRIITGTARAGRTVEVLAPR
jgi:flagella basal body P-ring formation protein FlgA